MWEEKVRLYLRDHKISQETFAESLGVTQGWLSHKLTGKRKATVSDLSMIAKKIGIPLSDLLEQPSKVGEEKGEYHAGAALKDVWESSSEEEREEFLRDLISKR